MTEQTSNQSSGTTWFVGASFGHTDDQSARFLDEGMWEISSPSQKEQALVRSMRPGERIAIKAGCWSRIISRGFVSNTPAYPKKLPIVLIATLATLLLTSGAIATGELLRMTAPAPRNATCPRPTACAPRAPPCTNGWGVSGTGCGAEPAAFQAARGSRAAAGAPSTWARKSSASPSGLKQ